VGLAPGMPPGGIPPVAPAEAVAGKLKVWEVSPDLAISMVVSFLLLLGLALMRRRPSLFSVEVMRTDLFVLRSFSTAVCTPRTE
jgi:hypothetical protein